MMSANERKKTTGKLQAKGTTVEGFSTTDVLAYQNLSDLGFSFEGRNDKGEWLVFFVPTLDIKVGVSYKIEKYGSIGTATAHYKGSSGGKYDGESGQIKFTEFDKLSQKAVFEVKALIRNSVGDEKNIEVKGEFTNFESGN